MMYRLPKSAFKPLLIASLSLVVAGGFALALIPAAKPLARPFHPHSPSPSAPTHATTSPQPTAAPAVAGATTIAPTATPKPIAAPASAVTPGTTCPSNSGSTVLLTIRFSSVVISCAIRFSAGNDPCTILREAQAERIISTLTIYDSPTYVASHGKSAYLYELNGYKDNWTYSAQDPTGKPLPAPGCSLTALQGGDRVTWRFGG